MALGMDEQELEYVARHPGGFDREFFDMHLMSILEHYWTSARLPEPNERVVIAHLRTRGPVAITAARAALTYVVLFTEDMELVTAPYSEVVGIYSSRRREPAPKHVVGFTVESAD
jgi:hypothetical protein